MLDQYRCIPQQDSRQCLPVPPASMKHHVSSNLYHDFNSMYMQAHQTTNLGAAAKHKVYHWVLLVAQPSLKKHTALKPLTKAF